MKKGDIIAFRNHELLAMKWMDKRVVSMLSTAHKGSKQDVSIVAPKNPANDPILKPNVIVDYTKHMGAVDRADHYISSYQFMRRSKKWYRKVFFWLLEVSIVNSYLLHSAMQKKDGKTEWTHKRYREKLVESLVEGRMSQK